MASTSDGLEIERKFLVEQLPAEYAIHPHKAIKQGYLTTGSEGVEVRVRRKGDRFFLTVKKGVELVRQEAEIEISTDQFETLWPMTVGQRLEKVRYEIPYEGRFIELDLYEGGLSSLMTAEVEFPSVEASQQFTPPAWFGREITTDSRYLNSTLARHGMP